MRGSLSLFIATGERFVEEDCFELLYEVNVVGSARSGIAASFYRPWSLNLSRSLSLRG